MARNQSNISSILSSLQCPYLQQATEQIMFSLQQFHELAVSSRIEYLGSNPVVSISGTIPVMYKGNKYNIPIGLKLGRNFPYQAPDCFVVPTDTMSIRESRIVDKSGRVYLPYITEWRFPNSDLSGLLQVMSIQFGESCPVFANPNASRSNPQPPTTTQQPYPGYSASPSGGGMPMPSGGGYGYNSPPYPSPGYTPPAPPTGGSGYPAPYPITATNAYQTQAAPNPSYGAGNTITEEHIRASLLSAVQDQLKRRAGEKIGGLHGELASLKNTSQELTQGSTKIKAKIDQIRSEQVSMAEKVTILQSKLSEADELVRSAANDTDLQPDDAIDTTAPLYRQLINANAEDQSIEDLQFSLMDALRVQTIDLTTYLKEMRRMARTQFLMRETVNRCRQRAGLDPLSA